MSKITITAISCSLLLLVTSCKKCYICRNGCCERVSTGQLICSTDFNSFTEYYDFIDSLSSDIFCDINSRHTFSKKVCNDEQVQAYEATDVISCQPEN
jgi:hypothetical protein